MRKYLAAAVATSVALLALVGCTDDDPKPPKATPSTSTTPADPTSSSATVTDPTAGLTPEQVVRAWIKARNRLLQSGDSTGVMAMAAPECKTCAWLVDPVVAVHEAGGRFAGGKWTAVSVKLLDDRKGKVVSVAIKVAAGSTVQSEGSKPQAYAAEAFILEFTLKSVTDHWRISDIVKLS